MPIPMPILARRIALAALLLGTTALSGPAQAGWFSSDDDAKSEAPKKAVVKTDEVKPAQTLDGSIRQAQLLRLAGQYDDAIKHLSQLMLVASDDGRVVTEYGKTLAAMGRASEAVNFLTRAQQLSPNDWSVYSAMGVAYDQIGKQPDAQRAYEHALALKPEEPSVLNNYALSRMLAKDPDGARQLIARAQAAGGGEDAKIARNIAMIHNLVPEKGVPQTAVAAASPPVTVAQAPRPAPTQQVMQRPMPQVAQAAPYMNIPQPPTSAPRSLMPVSNNNGVINSSPQIAQQSMMGGGVVMQRVPADPLAGPVLPRVAMARPVHDKTQAPKAEKQASSTAPTPARTAATQALDLQAQALQMKADAIARQLAAKPQATASVVAAASKPDGADARPVTAKLVVKAEAPKPQPAKPAPVKTADAKPKAAKDSIPGLRLSANAY